MWSVSWTKVDHVSLWQPSVSFFYPIFLPFRLGLYPLCRFLSLCLRSLMKITWIFFFVWSFWPVQHFFAIVYFPTSTSRLLGACGKIKFGWFSMLSVMINKFMKTQKLFLWCELFYFVVVTTQNYHRQRQVSKSIWPKLNKRQQKQQEWIQIKFKSNVLNFLYNSSVKAWDFTRISQWPQPRRFF